jgi:hypothetical protein
VGKKVFARHDLKGRFAARKTYEAARETAEATLKSTVSAKTDARFRSKGEKSPGIRA